MQHSIEHRRRWANSWLATAKKNKSAKSIAFWQAQIDKIEAEATAKAFEWLGRGN